MNRTLLSKRISSLLAEVSRLSNALCAMSTMDLQRYPENYELLSTDAALRAEQIACRMRHLVYGFSHGSDGICALCRIRSASAIRCSRSRRSGSDFKEFVSDAPVR